MHKVFVCYHHDNDQAYKDMLVEFGEQNQIFIDRSVDTGDIADGLDGGYIRELIRNEYLRDSTVTIVLVGTETRRRKHVDWEIYSSMYDGTVNKRSGILVINLPTTGSELAWVRRMGKRRRISIQTLRHGHLSIPEPITNVTILTCRIA